MPAGKQEIENYKNTIIEHLNINFLRNKFIFSQDFDIFPILEPKLDNLFLNNQFQIDHYKIFRLDQNSYGGGLILYIASFQITNHLLNQNPNHLKTNGPVWLNG